MTASFEDRMQGFRLVGLRSDEVEIAVLPELGAKIVSLRDRRLSREWMWIPPEGACFQRLPTGSPFPESSLVGADECIPTIEPCRWRGRDLPDHGEVWTEAWELDEAEFANGRIVTRLDFPISPFRLQRTLTLRGAEIRFDYALSNQSDVPQEYLWAFHPLMAIEPGDSILLPPDCTRVRTDGSFNCPLGERGDSWNWPRPTTDMDLSRLDLGAEGRAVKLYTEPLSAGWAEVRNHRTGARLRFEFDIGEIDTVGIWMNRGGWRGYHHLAIEPTSGAPDPLDMAVQEWKRFQSVAPGGLRRWGFRLRVGN